MKNIRVKLFGVVLGSAFGLVSHAQASDVEFDFSGSWRMRYENLHNPIFPSSAEQRPQNNERISSRLLLKGEANWDNFNATVEIEDSRAWLSDGDPSIGSSQVNTLEPLQYFISYNPEDEQGLQAVTLGRFAIDHGSRRLIAKGVFRNTINTFDGALVDWKFDNWNVRGLYLLPVSRLPTAKADVWDNERAFDKSFTERKLFGFYAESDDKTWKVHSYWFKESDGKNLATKNRDLYTASVDYTTTIADVWKANVEVIGQTGTTRLSTAATDTNDVDVRAWMVHSTLGKKITETTTLRGEFDFASGDNNSADDKYEAFDGLYGVRRFDFGPTDVYQAMPRRNLLAVGLRSNSTFDSVHKVMLGYKAMWYHKAPDAVDKFIGHQVEARWRWQIIKSLRLEFGGAYLNKGDGFERGDYPDDSVYGYTAFLYKF